MGDFMSWKWSSEHVQVELANGEYVSAETTLVLAGPNRLSMLGTGSPQEAATKMYPMGLMQNIQIAQNRQVARLFEIGAKRSYFIPARLFANFQTNRILFYGPSLLRLLYAVAPVPEGSQPFVFDAEPGATPRQFQIPQVNQDYARLFPQEVLLKPGMGGRQGEDNRDFWINLASEVFNVPFGLCLLFKDARQRAYGAFYMEDCMIEAHSIGVDSNNIVLAEGINGQFDMVNPIQVQNFRRAAA